MSFAALAASACGSSDDGRAAPVSASSISAAAPDATAHTASGTAAPPRAPTTETDVTHSEPTTPPPTDTDPRQSVPSSPEETVPSSAPATPTTTSITTPATSPQTSPAGGSSPGSATGQAWPTGSEALGRAAVDDTVERLGVDPDAVEVVVVEEVTWRDSSLGCPRKGMQYLQVLTPGVRVVVEVDGRRRSYHGTSERDLSYCAVPQDPLGS
ncbi:hypothetical protein [Ilumatobacter sp.]|uniref:hypothetical protein n=1 Tax=Ilumatobacter sp. TaxID=1967498 RepID=UPI003B52E1CC